MSVTRAAALALLALAVAGCTESKEQAASRQARNDRELADALAGRVPGTPVDCIPNRTTNGPQIIGSTTLLYRDGPRIWRNDVTCPGMNSFSTLIVELHGTQICRLDRFRALDPGTRIPGPFCVFGQFTPYTRQ